MHFGYSRVVSDAPTTLNPIYAPTADVSLGFVPNLPVGLINIGGISNFTGGLHAVGEFVFHYNSYQVYDDVYWSHGKHTLKTGFAFERLQNNQLGTSNPNGQFNFGSFCRLPAEPADGLQRAAGPDDFAEGPAAVGDRRLRRPMTITCRPQPDAEPGRALRIGDRADGDGRPALQPADADRGDAEPGLALLLESRRSGTSSRASDLAYSPFKNDKTVVHAAYGIYDALPLNYLFEGLSIFSAPFFQSGSVSTAARCRDVSRRTPIRC